MSFELRLDESLRKSIRRIARQQMDRALEALSGNHKHSRDVAVHEARKSFKRVRSLLRLVRSEIGKKQYRNENRFFRHAGRPLTEVRDAKVLVEALDKLVKHFQEQLSGQTLGDIREALQDHLCSVREQLLDNQHAFAVEVENLRRARQRCKGWADVRDKWTAVHEGLKQAYRRARSTYGYAVTDPTVEKLHNWRKQIKHLRYQLDILRPLRPERMEKLIREAETMGELLGDDHDLAMLQQKLAQDSAQFGNATEIEAVLDLAQRRRTELEREAMLLGERYFRDRSKDFVRRLKGYWKAAKASRLPRPGDAA